MRYAVLGDVHSNLVALETVLEAAAKEGAETFVFVGDVIGYAANPKECLQIVRERAGAIVAGNHDWGAVGKVDLTYFNADARDAVEWTKAQLSAEELDVLAALPLTADFQGALLVHSTPYLPDMFNYIQTLYDAVLAFQKLPHSLAFVGHSHVPVVFVGSDPLDYFIVNEFELPADHKVIINVGSVGQPRDLDPRACYAIVDTELRTVSIRRVEYDIATTVARIQAAGLPETNAQRLFWGR